MYIHLPMIDRKAALLAGYEVGANPGAEIDFATLSREDRQTVVDQLDFSNYSGEPKATFRHSIDAPTLEALITAAKAAADKTSTERAELIAKLKIAIAAYETAEPEACEHGAYNGTDYVGTYAGFRAPYIDYPYVAPAKDEELSQLDSRLSMARESLSARAVAASKSALEAALPDLIAKTAQEKAERQEKAAQEEAEKEARIVARGASRLASGYWEKETSAYNERRFGKPWCAKVTGVTKGKLVYDWADWSGHTGDNGLLRVACKPGDVIAWGQKDFRKPHASDHTIAIMLDDGRMDTLTVVEAVKHFDPR
jgi:hypothetical protein